MEYFLGVEKSSNAILANVRLADCFKSGFLRSVDKSIFVSAKWKGVNVKISDVHEYKVYVLGNFLDDEYTLKNAIKFSVEKGSFDNLMNYSGNYNVIVKTEDKTLVYTDKAGLKPIYYVSNGSEIYYSSLAVSLNEILNGDNVLESLNLKYISSMLICGAIPELRYFTSPFNNVNSIPPGYCLKIENNLVSSFKYWKIPSEEVNLTDLSKKFKERLDFIVNKTIDTDKLASVSTDLSGGYDSTSIAIIAAKNLAEKNKKLTAITFKTLSKTDIEDIERARKVSEKFVNIDSMLINYSQALQSIRQIELCLTDHPDVSILNRNKFLYILRLIQQKDSSIYFSGHGGDPGLVSKSSYLVDLLKKGNIKSFVKNVFAWAREYNLAPLQVGLEALKLSLSSYNRYFLNLKKQIVNREHKGEIKCIDLSWSGSPVVANWFTDLMVEYVISLCDEFILTSHSYTNLVGVANRISDIHDEASRCRASQQIAELHGIKYIMPYLDNSLIDIYIQGDADTLSNVKICKPLLETAYSSSFPDDFFDRTMATHFTIDYLKFIRENLSEIRMMMSSSLLCKMGLIDLELFHEGLDTLDLGILDNLYSIWNTLTIELWLKSLSSNSLLS
jgi:asparagine synthase (glutamine-hydrolysing)